MLKNYMALAIMLVMLSGISSAYVSSIHAPAVLLNEDKGTLTIIKLNLTPGNGTVTVNNGTGVAQSTIQSAAIAAAYASNYTGVNDLRYNFNYNINSNSSNVSGPSAGLAMTLLAISAIQHRPLPTNFTVTGTINPNGTVGEIGGVYDKVGAANASRLDFAIVPWAPNDSLEYLLYYISQQHYDMPLVMARNVSQALRYVYGQSAVKPLQYNISQDLHANLLQNASATCNACDNGTFSLLANYTFNTTKSEIDLINGSRYGNVKLQMLSQLRQYEAIARKGYLYVGADYAFLEYQEAFIFANADNFNTANATTVLDGATSFCRSVIPPQLTSTNYEYIVGGELRQSWANITIANAHTVLNDSQSTDEIITALYTVAPAYGWCQGAHVMYSIAGLIGGTPIAFSNSLKARASNAYQNSSALPPDLYTEAVMGNYRLNDYAATIYASAYSSAFGTPAPAISSSRSGAAAVGSMVRNASANSLGVWSQQFADEAQFYMNEANLSSNSTYKKGLLLNAYTTAVLSEYISSANRLLMSNLDYNVTTITPVNASLQAQVNQLSQSLNSSQEDVAKLSAEVFNEQILILAIIVILIIVVMMQLRILKRQQQQFQRRPARRQSR
ncbi:MAG: hypothetical protein KGH72_03295 [Candidatus Micrarchaeota archaeon]|nr:hypothetical protein [Candidatus Micrarchaeota archaeon]